MPLYLLRVLMLQSWWSRWHFQALDIDVLAVVLVDAVGIAPSDIAAEKVALPDLATVVHDTSVIATVKV